MHVAEIPKPPGRSFSHSTAGAAEDEKEEEVDEGMLTMGTVGTEGLNMPTELKMENEAAKRVTVSRIVIGTEYGFSLVGKRSGG